jgi:undecaprenyl-diphosphatase
VDHTWLILLNGLPAHVHGLGRVSALVAKDGIFLYPLLLLWLWWRRSGDPARNRLLASEARTRRREVLLLAVAAAVLALIVNQVVSHAVVRPRPYVTYHLTVLIPAHERLSSFPSDHTAVAGAIAMTLLLGGEAGWGWAALVGAVVIGVARVVAGVHYPSDILGGLAVGLFSGIVVLWIRAPLRPALDAVIQVARFLRLA